MRLSQTRRSDGLFRLIKSLEKSEKRHIRLLLKHSYKKDVSRYERVFHILDQLKVYDENEVTRKICRTLSLSTEQIPVIKHLLYNFILKGLRQLYGNKSVDFELRDLLDRVEILYAKGLYQQSFKLLKKATVKAVDQASFTYLAELSKWSCRLQFELTEIWDEAKLKALFEEQRQLFSSSVEYFEKEMSAFKLWSYAVTRVSAYDDVSLRQILQPEVRGHIHAVDKKPLLYREEIAQNRLSAIFHSILGNFDRSFSHYQKAVDISTREGERLFSKVNYLHDLLDSVVRSSSDTDTTRLSTDKWPRLLEHLVQCELKHEDQVTLLRLFFQLYKGLIHDAVIEAQPTPLLQLIKRSVIHQDFFSRFKCSYYLLLHSFICENYPVALQYLNEVQSNRYKFVFGPLNIFSRILSLIVHFELGDFAMLDHLYRSAQHFMKKNPFRSVIHVDLLRLVKKLYLAKDKQDLNGVMHELLVFVQNDTLHQSLALGKLERRCLTSWVNARLNRSDVLVEYSRIH